MSLPPRKIRVALLSQFQPTPENRYGLGSLIYWTARTAPAEVQLDIAFGVDRDAAARTAELRASLSGVDLRHTLAVPAPTQLRRWVGGARARWRGLPLGAGTRSPQAQTVAAVRAWQPEIAWVFPNYWLGWLEALRPAFSVLTGPDAESLWIERALGAGTAPRGTSLEAARRLDTLCGRSPDLCHVVGQADADTINRLAGSDRAWFVPHPHPPAVAVREPLEQAPGRLTVLFTGGLQRLYLGDLFARTLEALAGAAAGLREGFRVRFVGRGYEAAAERLQAAGYEVQRTPWVEDYPATLAEAHVQVFPIQVGSGTKGKVLQAMATGLLCIGSPMAMENVQAEAGRDYLLFHDPAEIPALLQRIHADRGAAAAMAARGRAQVLQRHSPEATGRLFWETVLARFREQPRQPERGRR